MSIQKIMSVSPLKAHMQQLSKRETPEKPEVQRNDTELLKSDALKSRFLSGISFKGHSANIQCATSGAFDHSDVTEIIRGKKPVNIHNYYSGDEDVYFADMDEVITPEILKNHAAVLAYKKMPAAISEEQIKAVKNSSEFYKIIADLELTGKLFEVRKGFKTEERNKINEDITKTEMILNRQRDELKLKSDEIHRLEENIMNTDEKVELAKDCCSKVRETEEKERIKNETINAMRTFLYNTNSDKIDDEYVSSMRKAAQEYLDKLTQPPKTDN